MSMKLLLNYNDDFISNIKPDGTMTEAIRLGFIMLEVPRSEDLVANFDKLSIEQQKLFAPLLTKPNKYNLKSNKQYDETSNLH